MGITSTQGFKFKLVADGVILDLFKEEEIKLSDNVTGLFDLGVLPADFTRQITLPGTKKNNHFFEFVYDISVEDPYTFATNRKVKCYLDFDGIYLSDGYIQLNKVNVYQNKFIDSYEVTIFGGLASFGRDLKTYFLSDLTSLSQYNHTSSLSNITSSWEGNLFDGVIRYPLAEYGQQIQYAPQVNNFGIDEPSGSLCVQDFKPAIRVKKVWDACFDKFGFTYSSSFMDEPWWDNVYMLCNNKLRYPIYNSGSSGGNGIDLESYGLFKISPISGSGQTNVTMTDGVDLPLLWYNVEQNPGGNISPSTLEYQLGFNSSVRGELQLNFEVSSSGVGSGVPFFNLKVKNLAGSTVSTIPLTNINNYMTDVKIYNGTQTKTEKFELTTQFNTGVLPANTYKFFLQYNATYGTNFNVILNPDNSTNASLSITKVNQGGDGLILDIPSNMPAGISSTSAGTNGIKLIDFITSVQKKFNLVIYPNKTKLNEFIVEPFNRWYKTGKTIDFNKYINLNEKIAVTPANNLAVQQLNFGDTLDGDYVSQQFSKGAGREFGKAYYVDTENYFSQGTFEVKTGFASSPLVYLNGTGISGSQVLQRAGFQAFAVAETQGSYPLYVADTTVTVQLNSTNVVSANVSAGPDPTYNTKLDPPVSPYYAYRNVQAGDSIKFIVDLVSYDTQTYQFVKETDAGTITLASGIGSTEYVYTITTSDVASSILNFSATGYSLNTN